MAAKTFKQFLLVTAVGAVLSGCGTAPVEPGKPPEPTSPQTEQRIAAWQQQRSQLVSTVTQLQSALDALRQEISTVSTDNEPVTAWQSRAETAHNAAQSLQTALQQAVFDEPLSPYAAMQQRLQQRLTQLEQDAETIVADAVTPQETVETTDSSAFSELTGLTPEAFEKTLDEQQATLGQFPNFSTEIDLTPSETLTIGKSERFLQLQALLDAGLTQDASIAELREELATLDETETLALLALRTQLKELDALSQTLQGEVETALDDDAEKYDMTEMQFLNKEVMQISKEILAVAAALAEYKASLEAAAINDPPPDNTTDQATDSTIQAALAFNTLKRIELGQTRPIKLIISPLESAEVLAAKLQAEGLEGEITKGKIKLSKRVEASLTGTSALEITTPPNISIQDTAKDEHNEWTWLVKANEKNDQPLILQVARVADGDSSPKPLYSQVVQVDVKVTLTQNVVNFVSNNWQWLWTAIVLPVGAWVWRSGFARKTETEQA